MLEDYVGLEGEGVVCTYGKGAKFHEGLMPRGVVEPLKVGGPFNREQVGLWMVRASSGGTIPADRTASGGACPSLVRPSSPGVGVAVRKIASLAR